MESALSIVGVTFVAYGATNFDNLLILVGIFAREGQSLSRVVGGVAVATLVTLLICLAAAGAADFAPPRWLGYLGIVPIMLGLRELHGWMPWAKQASHEVEASGTTLSIPDVAGLLLANGADTLGALVPLFAESKAGLLPVTVATVVAGSLILCALARHIVSDSRIGPPIRRVGPKLVPFLLIAIGIYVLLDTPTDSFEVLLAAATR